MKIIDNSSFDFQRNIRFFVLIMMLGILSSCVTQKDVEYIQDKNHDVKKFNEVEKTDYKLKPSDELYIQISSLDDAAANVFSNTGQQLMSVGTIEPYGASFLSHTIDKEGFLILPVIGKLLVKDKTISEVTDMLKESLANILSQPVISVKLVNRFVSILGEVRTPGHFPYTQDKLTVFDALGLAGDMTDFANRRQVILIRNENGENSRINLDLSRSDIFTSEYYFLRPNDIVYVKPLRKKFWDLRVFPYATILSAITAALLIYTVVK